MAYTPPIYNQVNVDLYSATALSIPVFNQVNVDLAFDLGAAQLDTIGLSLLSSSAIFPLTVSTENSDLGTINFMMLLF